ncbi:hypothetical protein R3P38DRAFT_2498032 [Favolaschia claudopus]|uniref:Integrase core domain-containing protein n=1 Tax=Favolaschia claudopus TaxID=2862362 RepID=A0AAW0DZX3_9AGAR
MSSRPRKKRKTPDNDSDEEDIDGSDDDNTQRSGKRNARNPTGRNQHARVPPLEDIADQIRKYHAENPTFKYQDYMAAFMKDHGIKIGRSKLAKYISQLGLSTSSRGNRMPKDEQTQLVLDELSKDPLQTRGPRVVKEALNLAGHKIGRNTISDIMHDFQEEGFLKRHPRSKKKTIFRTPLTSVGPHEEWSVDGHDKLNVAGFGVYGIRDKWGGTYLHYRVLPSNRYADVVGVVYLECAKKYGGVPIQGSSDHGSEVCDAHAVQVTLRNEYSDYDPVLIPAWEFLSSTRNITIESGWRPLFYTWGVNVLEFYQSGLNDGFFEPGNVIHEQTSNWIWFPAVQRSLDEFCHQQQNNHRIRKQPAKLLPSGGTPNEFVANPTAYGGEDCLVEVPKPVLDRLLEEARETAQEHMRFVDDDFDVLAQDAYKALGEPEITLQNAWVVFRDMIAQLDQM